MCSELSCPLCSNSNFPDIETFKSSLIKVNSKPIKCPLCNEVLLGLDKLTIHLFGHSFSKGEKTIETPPPSKPKKEPKAKQNRMKLVKMPSPLKTSDEKEKFRCEICGFVFVDEHLLNLHLSLVHNFTPNDENSLSSKTEIIKFQCHLCSKHFKMKGALRIHIKVAHVRFHDQNKRQINIADYLKNQKSIDQCTMKTEMLSLKEPYSPDKLYQQQRSPISSPASYFVPSPQNSSNGDLKETKKIVDRGSKLFQCDDCKKTFTTKYFLKKHKRLHTGEMPYSCEKCGKNFFFQQSFHKHKLYCYHNDEKPYECSECGRSFKELSTLHNHERIHSGVKPFGCEICGKFFRQRVSYLVHSRIHTGALPYKCSECGKDFRYKISQRSHKCSGVLVKQPGELIQKLMQNASILPSSTVISSTDTNETTNTMVKIPYSNQAQLERHELCFDDLLKEDSYEKLMENPNNVAQQLVPVDHSENSFNDNSSVMTFNDLRINSNYGTTGLGNDNNFHMTFPPMLETINEDSIKELLGALR